MNADEGSREQAFTTGFVADLARIQLLPDDMIEWILQACEQPTMQTLNYVYLLYQQCLASRANSYPLRT